MIHSVPTASSMLLSSQTPVCPSRWMCISESTIDEVVLLERIMHRELATKEPESEVVSPVLPNTWRVKAAYAGGSAAWCKIRASLAR